MLIILQIVLWIIAVLGIILALFASGFTGSGIPENPVFALFYNLFLHSDQGIYRTGYLIASAVSFGSLGVIYSLEHFFNKLTTRFASIETAINGVKATIHDEAKNSDMAAASRIERIVSAIMPKKDDSQSADQ